MGLFSSDIIRSSGEVSSVRNKKGASSNSRSNMDILPETPSKYTVMLPTWVFIIIAIFFPPGVILLVKPKLSLELLVVILLTLLLWLPGTIYAIYIAFEAKKVLEEGLNKISI